MYELWVAGLGPGSPEHMTDACRACLRNSEIIVGYTGYIDPLRPLLPDKIFHATGMTRERERCLAALRFAREGKKVCVVSSGDSGVYGMAGLLIELAADFPDVTVRVIPGVTAAVSGAALLGAPLANDFAVISLSDLLTPWETVEKRLRAAAAGDFAICLYNPGSRKRTGHLSAVCEILLETLPPCRICGITSHIGREGQKILLTTLSALRGIQTGMSDTVFIGNSQTRNIGGKMVTLRGYGAVPEERTIG